MAMPNPITMPTEDGSLEIKPLASGKHVVRFIPRDPGVFVPVSEFESTFPLALLSELGAKNGAWLCEELSRHERFDYVVGVIGRQIRGFIDPAEMAGKRFLDFGCGSGASTFGLSRMLPDTDIVGIELNPASISRARLIAQYRANPRVQFLQSPSSLELPGGIGDFDYVMLSAVWEHLLPEERPVLTAKLWKILKPGGCLFINQTPYRWSPLEHHTTGLWFVNYLPEGLALRVARKWSRQTPEENAACNWRQLLRKGIRGGTEREILSHIPQAHGQPILLQPRAPYRDRADYWLGATSPRRKSSKKLIAAGFRLTDKLWGTVPSTHLEMAIRKAPRA